MLTWSCRARLDIACAHCGRHLETRHADGNLLVYGGASALWARFIGGTTPAAFNSANAHLGVGNGAAASTPEMTDLQGTSTVRQPMTAGFPQHTDGTDQSADEIRYQAEFPDGVAEFDWRELGLFNASSGGTMLNRRAVNFGVKPADQVWTLTLYLRLYGNEEGRIDVPVGEAVPGVPVYPTGPSGVPIYPMLPGGGGVIPNSFAQFVWADNAGTSDVPLGVKGRLPVRQPGTLTIWDVLADPAGDITWTVSKWTLLGTTLVLTAAVVGADFANYTGLNIPVANGDVLEFEVTACSGVHRSTISLSVQGRTDRRRQLFWGDRASTGVLAAGVRGQQIARFAGLITGWDLLADPSGDVAWEVYRNGSLLLTATLVGGETAAATGLSYPVASGDIFEFVVTGTTVDVVRSTISLTVEP